jgi:hypothetical protein
VDAGANTTVNKLLCTEECQAQLESLETHETKSGLKYKDIVVGKGPSPPTGYQVWAPAAGVLLPCLSSLLLPGLEQPRPPQTVRTTAGTPAESVFVRRVV